MRTQDLHTNLTMHYIDGIWHKKPSAWSFIISHINHQIPRKFKRWAIIIPTTLTNNNKNLHPQHQQIRKAGTKSDQSFFVI